MQFIRVLIIFFVIVVANSYSFATDAGPSPECSNTLIQLNPSAIQFIAGLKKAKSAKAEAKEALARISLESKKMAKATSPLVPNTFNKRIDTNLKSLLQENEINLSNSSFEVISAFAINKNLNLVALVPHELTNRQGASRVILARLYQNGMIEFVDWIAKPNSNTGNYSKPEFIGNSDIMRVTKKSGREADVHFYDLSNGKKELNSLSEVLNLTFSTVIAFSETVYAVEVAETREIIIFEHNPINDKAQIFFKGQPSSNNVMEEILSGSKNISAEVIGEVLKLTTPDMTIVLDHARKMVVSNRVSGESTWSDFGDVGLMEQQLNKRAGLALFKEVGQNIVGISPVVTSDNIAINGTINLVIIPKN